MTIDVLQLSPILLPAYSQIIGGLSKAVLPSFEVISPPEGIENKHLNLWTDGSSDE